MRRTFVIIEALATGFAALIAGQRSGQAQGTLQSFNAAFYSSGAMPGTPRLSIFPLTGSALTVTLPFVFGAFTFGADGKKLFAVPLHGHPEEPLHGLFVIELNPVRAAPVRGSESFVIVSLAVPAGSGKVILTGGHHVNRATDWGIFELDPSDGGVKIVARHEAPGPGVNGELWSDVSVSPDGTRAVATRHKKLDMIDLLKGTVESLGSDLEQGTWSPDGKWLAVNDRKNVRTVLLDAATLAPRRRFPWSHLRWSPDSRYLLGAVAHDPCGSNFGTLQAINIETGEETEIPSSRCKIDSVTTGWVNAEIR
jgi:WD40-like Beta Propeller Repeat